MASDFHTHNAETDFRALITTPIPLVGKLTSLLCHPWFLPKKIAPEAIITPEKLSSFNALGEIGLDKLRGPEMEIQQYYFHYLLTLAADCRKPVVIHCVRAFQEFFAAIKPFKLRILFHGFRSSPELLDELWKRRITVSFHPQAANNPALMKKLTAGTGKFGFESDDDRQVKLPEIIATAEKTSGTSGLEAATDQFFADFLEI